MECDRIFLIIGENLFNLWWLRNLKRQKEVVKVMDLE
jgi:hypothetical protein